MEPATRIDRDDLVLVLGHWDSGSGPLYRQLSDGLRRLLEIGRYESGSHLPPERHLAKALAVSRNTVASAYGELRKEGWVQARQGAATVIASANHSPAASHRESGLFATLVKANPAIMDLTIAVPKKARIVEDILDRPSRFIDMERQLGGHGYHALGLEDLREAVAEKLTKQGLSTTSEEVLITGGAQEAISLLVRALTRPGDSVVMDEITYPGVMDAVSASRAIAVPVRAGARGTDVWDLRKVIEKSQARLAYLVPTFHNPTGALLDGSDLANLARVVTETGVTVIDDQTLADLDHTLSPGASLAAIAPDASVITIGSASKVFWGGLRVGWIRAREPVIALLASHKVSHDIASSVLSQAVTLAALGHLEEARSVRNEELRASCEALGNALQDHIPDWSWIPPDGGPYAWIKMPGADGLEFAQLALRRGVAVAPGELLAVRKGAASDWIRLPLYPMPDELVKGITALSSIWTEYRGRNSF